MVGMQALHLAMLHDTDAPVRRVQPVLAQRTEVDVNRKTDHVHKVISAAARRVELRVESPDDPDECLCTNESVEQVEE